MKIMHFKTYQKLPLYKDLWHIRILKNRNLLKCMNAEQLPLIKELSKKTIPHTILPEEIYHILFMNGQYAYSMQQLIGYQSLGTFGDYEMNYSDREILCFFRNLLEGVETLHENGVYSGDIWEDNILIDENLDYYFIDFNGASTDDFYGEIGRVPTFLENYNSKNLMSYFSFTKRLMLSDKMSLLNMIFYCMETGNFQEDDSIVKFEHINYLRFPKMVENYFNLYWKEGFYPSCDNYFLEVFDELIKKNYGLPYRKRKVL